MAKFYFKYGVMNSSKTANLLMVAHNYESQGRRILCLKSALDTRWADSEDIKKGKIESRAIPSPHECELISPTENIFNIIKQFNNETILKYSHGLSAVLVDEAQFLTKEQVKELSLVVEKLNIDVICFGLKNTYIDGELFEGTAALLYYATSIEEIKTICKYCNRKATMNLRIVNGKAIYSGDSLAIGDVVEGSDTYAQVCYHHYLNPPAPIIGSNNHTKQSYTDKFMHILRYQNPFGYFRKTSEIAKLGYSFGLVYPIKRKEDIKKLKYLVLGPICVDLEEYSKKYSKNKQVNSVVVTDCIIRFLYRYFENDMERAFRLLKSSTCSYAEFCENDEEYEDSLRTRNSESYKKCYRKLPDGRYYYIDSHTKNSWDFYQSILTGFSMSVNNIEVGFYYSED